MTEPATLCIMWFLDRLSPYNFNHSYIEEKDIFMVYYLSRHHFSNDNTTDLIPKIFCCFSLFLHHKGLDTFQITMRSQAKAAEEGAPNVHGTDKTLDPFINFYHQSISVIQTAPTPASKRSNVQSLAKKLISKSIQQLVKKVS